jgi:hypothetical protein
VALLHAQVERLSMLQLERSSEEGHVSVSRGCCYHYFVTGHLDARKRSCRVMYPSTTAW